MIILGASNVVLGFRTITGLLRAGFAEPLDLRLAFGHGRSYGVWNKYLIRSLPGLRDCGLWTSLATAPPLPTSALVTDIGNDLLYGLPPERIAEWVDMCVRRLRDGGADLIITRPPIERLLTLSASHYHAARLFFFPGHRFVDWPEMRSRVQRLDDLLALIAETNGAKLIRPQPNWYGLDPIHLRRVRRPEAWRSIFSGWDGYSATNESTETGLSLLGLLPAEFRLLGRPRTRPQPAIKRDGLSVSLY